MYKQIQSQFFLVAFLLYLHPGTASAVDYEIKATFKQYPGSVSHIVLIDEFCMDSADDNVKLDNNGNATISLDTSGIIFNECGWRHSSATYQALDDNNEVKVEFEFYKPLSEEPYLKLNTPDLKFICFVSGPSSYSLEIECGEIP